MTTGGDANGGGCSNSSSSSTSSVGPLSPKSPPRGLDLYGKRRQVVKFQVLEREIGLLQEEIKLIEVLQPASTSCKELDDFVVAKQDPFLATNHDIRKSHFLKRLWRKCCFCLPWICCLSCRRSNQKMSNGCSCCPSFTSRCCAKKTSGEKCCTLAGVPSLHCCCSSFSFKSLFCKCTKVNICCLCVKPCCL